MDCFQPAQGGKKLGFAAPVGLPAHPGAGESWLAPEQFAALHVK